MGVFPVTQVVQAIDRLKRNGSMSLVCVKSADDPVMYQDAPIELQCMGRKGPDEAVIRMT
ncbi:BQ2448_5760 [Microbotryum intermedium]|uniref:BQ2448_5760 protein n=1 Tax=Microbotryum intermedium TaxID=269621 RepID=A0A238F5N3_9BASI|nr:BQ2448_5760 [Microbotryum intermedium]